jgi:hypothetical protein
MKKGKSVTFQLQDEHERELFEYVSQMHNFSGTIKRQIGASEGFQEWKAKRKRRPAPVVKSASSGGIKINLG